MKRRSAETWPGVKQHATPAGMHLRKAKYRRPPPEPRPCGGCGVPIATGTRCIKCRVQKCRGLGVEGLACRVCGIGLARVLKLVRFLDEPEVPLCANHAALAGRRPLTWQAFEAEAAEREGELTPAPATVALRRAG